MIRAGLIVNPVAGVGGPKAHKGSDGSIAAAAMAEGAVPLAGSRTREAIISLIASVHEEGVELPEMVTCSGSMGEQELVAAGFPGFSVIYNAPSVTSASDTARAAALMKEHGMDIILFAGGDGTARDVARAVGEEFPILGIPAGVKMYTGAFLNMPSDLGRALIQLMTQGIRTMKIELLDFSSQPDAGSIGVEVYGKASIPVISCSQAGKSEHPSTQEELDGISSRVLEKMKSGAYFVMGTGNTVKAIMRRLGHSTPVLGVDLLIGTRLLASDVTDERLTELLSGVPDESIFIVVSPIGGNGFLFGRGNQQIPSSIIGKAAGGNIIVVSTTEKMNRLRKLRVDSGDTMLDLKLKGIVEVITGYTTLRVSEIE